jgi:hypothetical protein
MKNLPGGTDLLSVARETLLSELRPLLDERGRYTLAMVANAMAIAAREADAGEGPALAALARLDELHKHPTRELRGEALAEALSVHERRLAADIRAGRYDAANDVQRALLEHLREAVHAKLRVSNPKNLASPGQ